MRSFDVDKPKESPEELAAFADFRANIWTVFQELYEDKWDQERWDTAVAEFQARHDPAAVEGFWATKKLPSWDALEMQMRRGPPIFLRPGWISPLIEQEVDLEWIDDDTYECIKSGKEGWRTKKILIVEFWASWCPPCVKVFNHMSYLAKHPDIHVITYNDEGIFTEAETDVDAVRDFVATRDDMNYPIYIDIYKVAVKALFKPGKNYSVPLAFVITTKDNIVRWIGNPENMAEPLEEVLMNA